MVELIFWVSLAGVAYAYVGYPLVLFIIGKCVKRPPNIDTVVTPSISILIPAHNEERVIKEKLENVLALEYPEDKIEILIISDGSTDATESIVEAYEQTGKVKLFRSTERKGKANALNIGLSNATGDVLVFMDASMELKNNALIEITRRFNDPAIGCISGEDFIPESGGEGAYGRYELWLRNLESRISSIVGASGSFYAQRREICVPFVEGLAPDFLSVLNTVEKGYRAITEPAAIGTMASVKNAQDEFQRKVRTLLRGMTTLFYKKQLLNPFLFGFFVFELISHKLMRWMVPFFLIAILVTNIYLLDQALYKIIFVLQAVFYLFAILAGLKLVGLNNTLIGKIPLYFVNVNLAIIAAWFKYFIGVRQEIWTPSNRT
ncbi:MAG: glycosyltransferase family 2 protein, partial [Gammaproteobacteria bacterium]|nr:glycosyltransferase family 2 protein [Gammaproteobacteria bacterium]